MVRPAPLHGGGGGGLWVSLPLAIGVFVSVSAVVTLCVKHGRRVSRKCAAAETGDPKLVARSPLPSLLTTFSSKAVPFVYERKQDRGAGRGEESEAGVESSVDEEGGLWQRAILMGEKCQPPEFSGVIYYDYDGNQISELPRSPRPTTPLQSFSFPAVAKG